jgi:2-oxo-4-hydroxy-4-carboxy-5-ureidoimidazoline decarboxylase
LEEKKDARTLGASMAFREYAMHGSTERMRKYAAQADVHAFETETGRTALHKAAFWGHVETVTYLLDECKLDVNAVDFSGDTALHDAARFGHRAVIDKLIAAGAATDIKNAEGHTSEDVAKAYGKAPLKPVRVIAEVGERRPRMFTLEELNAKDAAGFEQALGGIYEESPWVARAVSGKGPFKSVRALAEAMATIVNDADEETKLRLLRAHPDLAGRAALAGKVTAESSEEQSRAGLAHCTPEELEKFTALNNAYVKKFGFPFILAVRNATKRAILGAFERRLGNDSAAERTECLTQVHKIANMRLLEKVQHAPTGFLTCHVLDTARGCPAAGLRISLRRRLDNGEWRSLGTWITNGDGRLPNGPALKGADHRSGVYEWSFFVAEYYAAVGVPTAGTPFLDEVPLRFGIGDPEDHYHVPLLVSPWSCATYRGS